MFGSSRTQFAQAASADASEQCRFCNIVEREPLIDASSEAVVAPSFGAFIEGWTLVIPRMHVLSIAALSDDEWPGFESMLSYHRERMRDIYGPIVEFEHGSAGPCRSAGCGTDHAHRHFVPSDVDLRQIINDCPDFHGRFSWSSVNDRPPCVPGLDYIWISDATGMWIAFDKAQPSQVVRRALAYWCGKSEWDWRSDLHLDIVENTRQHILAAV